MYHFLEKKKHQKQMVIVDKFIFYNPFLREEYDIWQISILLSLQYYLISLQILVHLIYRENFNIISKINQVENRPCKF